MMQILLLLILFLFASFPVFAQSQLSQRWVCLRSQVCSDPASKCSGKGVLGHRAILSAKEDAKPFPNKDTYIVECLATTSGQVCTTGNTNTDIVIYGKDNTAGLKTSDDYQFQGIFKSDGVTSASAFLKSKASGDIDPLEWQSYSKGNARKFLALNFFDPNGGTGTMGKGGEQQGTFSFETQSNLKDCVSISWDPYGRVFDSQSLEPIPEVSVELLKKRNNGVFSQLLSSEMLGGAIENPYSTIENGYYSFVIPDGTYKLSAFQQNYIFPNDKTKLNSGYTKAYSDLYPNNTGVEIVQAGTVQHRDIPLDPIGQGINYPVKLIEYFYNLDKTSNKAFLEGVVSHPLTNIRFYSVKPQGEVSQILIRHKLIKNIQADKYGKFKTEIDQSIFEPTEVFGDMELEKVDLTKITALKQKAIFKTVEAAQSSVSVVRFNPILNSLKGYAYDNKKNILPRANVDVYLAYSSRPYYETKTDEKGYYEISPERLPDSSYSIKYSTVIGSAQVTSTSKFIAQNNTYLEKNNINLNSNKTSPKNREFITKSEGSKFDSSSPARQITSTKRSSENNTRFLIIVVILLFLIAGVGGALGFYLIKKNKNH